MDHACLGSEQKLGIQGEQTRDEVRGHTISPAESSTGCHTCSRWSCCMCLRCQDRQDAFAERSQSRQEDLHTSQPPSEKRHFWEGPALLEKAKRPRWPMQRLQETLCSRGWRSSLWVPVCSHSTNQCTTSRQRQENEWRYTIFELSSRKRLAERARLRQSIGKPQPLQEASPRRHVAACTLRCIYRR